MRYFLNKKYANKEKIIGPAKQIIYIRFPYISKYMNEILNREIRKTRGPSVGGHTTPIKNFDPPAMTLTLRSRSPKFYTICAL